MAGTDLSSAARTRGRGPAKRPPSRWISLRSVPDAGPVDVFGRPLEAASRPDLESTLEEASLSNLSIPVYRDLVASCGADQIFVAAGSHAEDPDIVATHDYGRTTVFEDVIDRYLSQPVVEEPAPGLRNANFLGLAAMLRHEHAHELWGRLDRGEPEYVCVPIPRDAAQIASGLSTYAGESFGDELLLDDPHHFPSRRFVEAFCECFEIGSHPNFDPRRFPEWVGEMWSRVLTLI